MTRKRLTHREFMPHASDGDLAAAAAAGSQPAWDALVERHAQLVWSVARGHGLGLEGAADVCQAVWLRLADRLGRSAADGPIQDWLQATVTREALAAKRRSTPSTGPQTVAETG